MRRPMRSGRRGMSVGAVFALVLGLCLLHGGNVLAAAGVPVRYSAGWNLVSGPAGTVFNSAGPAYSLGAGDAACVTSAADAPVTQGRGYWVYYATETTIRLNGTGTSSTHVEAPAGQWLPSLPT